MEQRVQELRRTDDPVTERIIGACIEVHRLLGPGLLESAYQQCLCRELALREIPFRRQVPLPVEYKGTVLDCGGYPTGLLVNFNVAVLKRGLRRLAPEKSDLLNS